MTQSIKNILLIIVGGIIGLFIGNAYFGGDLPEDKITKDSIIVARVNGDEITQAHLLNEYEKLPAQYKAANVENIYPFLLEQVITAELVTDEAKDKISLNDKRLKEALSYARLDLLRTLFVEDIMNEGVTDEALEESYSKAVASVPQIEEIKARHILLKSKADADAVIARLNKGEDFVELATAESTGPTSVRGGDLGYFDATTMVPEFSKAAFAMNVDDYSKSAVKTDFGWHVILVEDKRIKPSPSLNDLKPALEQQIKQKHFTDYIKNLIETAKIERFNFDGTENEDDLVGENTNDPKVEEFEEDINGMEPVEMEYTNGDALPDDVDYGDPVDWDGGVNPDSLQPRVGE